MGNTILKSYGMFTTILILELIAQLNHIKNHYYSSSSSSSSSADGGGGVDLEIRP